MAGQDFDALKKQAATREFKPVPLGVTASMTHHEHAAHDRLAQRRRQARRIDPELKDEYVVYTAHWDHFGIGAGQRRPDLQRRAGRRARAARRCSRSRARSPGCRRRRSRSILFLAVTAEEQGLLGSQYYSVTPIYPLAKTLAEHQHGQLERARPDQGPHARSASARRISTTTRATPPASRGAWSHGDAEPEKGFYYRSDHFNFAKQGVPALDPGRRRRLHRQAGRTTAKGCATSGHEQPLPHTRSTSCCPTGT